MGSIDLQAVKPCEDNFKSLFNCLNDNKDFNSCKSVYTTLKECSEKAKVAEKENEGEESNKTLSEALQAALPRVFKNAEDLPRERTVLADTLAKVAPHIFDPKDDDDGDD